MKCKKEELDDARNIIDSMQEKMMLVENELAAYKTKNIDHSKCYQRIETMVLRIENYSLTLPVDTKGNSLFAEVDDQRQQMRDLLQRQNQQYQMVSVTCWKQNVVCELC